MIVKQLFKLQIILLLCCCATAGAQQSDLELFNIEPIDSIRVDEDVRFRAFTINHGPDSISQDSQLIIYWEVKGSSAPTTYNISWQQGDTFGLLSPPYRFTSSDSVTVCAEIESSQDTLADNNRYCAIFSVIPPSSIGEKFNSRDAPSISVSDRRLVLTGNRRVTGMVKWRIFDLSGRSVFASDRNGECPIPQTLNPGIYIVIAQFNKTRISEKFRLSP